MKPNLPTPAGVRSCVAGVGAGGRREPARLCGDQGWVQPGTGSSQGVSHMFTGGLEPSAPLLSFPCQSAPPTKGSVQQPPGRGRQATAAITCHLQQRDDAQTMKTSVFRPVSPVCALEHSLFFRGAWCGQCGTHSGETFSDGPPPPTRTPAVPTES